MKLHYWRGRGSVKNFGDELNPWLWPKILGEILDDNEDEIFVGIGTILNDTIPRVRQTVVMGAGIGYGPVPPIDDSWKFYAVRGPLTARGLHLPMNLAITDPAILTCRYFDLGSRRKTSKVAFMPHWRNAHEGWSRVCEGLNFSLINPRDSVDTILRAISETELLLTEAMHGATVADAFRIPWIPVCSSTSDVLAFKWRDWCASMELEYQPYFIQGPWRPAAEKGDIRANLRASVKRVLGPLYRRMIESQLSRIVRDTRPCLSADSVLDDQLHRMEAAVDQFRNDQARRNT